MCAPHVEFVISLTGFVDPSSFMIVIVSAGSIFQAGLVGLRSPGKAFKEGVQKPNIKNNHIKITEKGEGIMKYERYARAEPAGGC